MDSRFNIPAPAEFKPSRDACVESVCRSKVAVRRKAGRGVFGQSGSGKTRAKKSLMVFVQPPVP